MSIEHSSVKKALSQHLITPRKPKAQLLTGPTSSPSSLPIGRACATFGGPAYWKSRSLRARHLSSAPLRRGCALRGTVSRPSTRAQPSGMLKAARLYCSQEALKLVTTCGARADQNRLLVRARIVPSRLLLWRARRRPIDLVPEQRPQEALPTVPIWRSWRRLKSVQGQPQRGDRAYILSSRREKAPAPLRC